MPFNSLNEASSENWNKFQELKNLRQHATRASAPDGFYNGNFETNKVYTLFQKIELSTRQTLISRFRKNQFIVVLPISKQEHISRKGIHLGY